MGNRTRLYDTKQLASVGRILVALSDGELYIMGWGNQWRRLRPLPFMDVKVRSISSDKAELYVVTETGGLYSVCGMYLLNFIRQAKMDHGWVKHWKHIPTGIRQEEE